MKKYLLFILISVFAFSVFITGCLVESPEEKTENWKISAGG